MLLTRRQSYLHACGLYARRTENEAVADVIEFAQIINSISRVILQTDLDSKNSSSLYFIITATNTFINMKLVILVAKTLSIRCRQSRRKMVPEENISRIEATLERAM